MTRHLRLLLFGISLWAILPACKKSISSLSQPKDPAILVAEARAWFQQNVQTASIDPTGPDNPRNRGLRFPLWDQAHTFETSDRIVVVVPLHYRTSLYLMNHAPGSSLFPIDQVARLVIYRDNSDAFHAEVITALPDSPISPESAPLLKGLLLIESWNGNLLYRLHSDGHNMLINDPGHEPSTIAADLITETCYEIDGYNYAADDPDNGESWTEDAGCAPNYYFGTPSSSLGLTAESYLDIGGGAGAPPPSPAGMFKVITGSNPISDIRTYLKCYQNVSGASYAVTLAVDQPIPGSRAPVYFPPIQLGGGFSVGHTFLIFEQTTASGSFTIRSIGFYPKTSASPTSPTCPGVLNDDEGHYSNISLTMSLSGQQFMNAINYAVNSANDSYDLSSFNCTKWALDCLSAAGVTINTIPGNWLLGSGDDPGDLGEDIRTMHLIQGMTLNTNVINAPSNTGTCP